MRLIGFGAAYWVNRIKRLFSLVAFCTGFKIYEANVLLLLLEILFPYQDKTEMYIDRIPQYIQICSFIQLDVSVVFVILLVHESV